jgi:hypothetical protein
VEQPAAKRLAEELDGLLKVGDHDPHVVDAAIRRDRHGQYHPLPSFS